MALTKDLSEEQLEFEVDGLEEDHFLVSRYRGTEGLCQLFRFEIELASRADVVAFSDVVGKAAVFNINASYGLRHVHGIVSRFEQTGETEDLNYFRAELVPTVWLLTHRYNCRIFQNKSVTEIISAVMEGAGVPTDRFAMRTQTEYAPKEYCVQYRETDYNFICRLMEEAGIRWFFEQTEEAHIFVMEDAVEYPAIAGDASTLPYTPQSGMNVSEEYVHRFRIGQAVRPGSVTLTDFTFENPKLNLNAHVDLGRTDDSDMEFYDYPGEFKAQGPGGDLATIRGEEFNTYRIHGSGRTNSHRLVPGYKFELTEHNSLAGQYLVTSVTHQGKQSLSLLASGTGEGKGILDPSAHADLQAASHSTDRDIRSLANALMQIAARVKAGDPTAMRSLTTWIYHAGQVAGNLPLTAQGTGHNPLSWLATPNLLEDPTENKWLHWDAPVYECIFECIPAAVPFRPARVTPWPVMRGSQTARVVGKQGEEIDVDKYGRVKVQFNWDRIGKFDENSSCWIRVSQGWSGGQYGIMFIPRIGQEVIVDFLEGDPDQPVITGRLFNADHMPPYALPDEKTKSVIKTTSSKGCKGNNEIRFEDLAGKEQLFLQAQRQMDTRVKASHYHTVGASYHLHIGGKKPDGEPFGDYVQYVEENKQVHIKMDQYTKIDKEEGRTIGGGRAVSVGGDCTVDVGKNRIDKVGAAHKHEVTAVYDLKATGGIKAEGSAGIELKCGGSSIVLTPAAIFITAPIVNINSGSGPPVSPATCTPGAPTEPEDAAVADSSNPGKNTTYSGGTDPTPGSLPADVPPRGEGDDEEEKEETFVLEYQLLDASEKEVPGEDCEIKIKDVVKPDTTDGQGVVKVEGLKKYESVYIRFPNRYDAEWKWLRTDDLPTA